MDTQYIEIVKPLNNGHCFFAAFVATIEEWLLLRGLIWLKITGLLSCKLALSQGLFFVPGGGVTIEEFHSTDHVKLSQICKAI